MTRFFLLEGSEDKCVELGLEIWVRAGVGADENMKAKTMKTFAFPRSPAFGRPAFDSLPRRIAFPLLLLTAGMMLVQPCAGQSGTWTGHRQPHHRTLFSHGDVVARRQGARRRRL